MKIIIFCGGFGTRMWPASRKNYPKQFYPLIKGKSFFQKTVLRFKKRFKPEDIFISTEEKYQPYIRKQAPEIPLENVIFEPERKDTLGGVGLITAVMKKKFPGDVMFFSWSDHFIGEEEEFLNAVEAAGNYCRETRKPVSIDERPTFASVHNGWLKIGKKVDQKGPHSFYIIEAHLEKPNKSNANRYYKSGDYLIHTGYGAWSIDGMFENFEKYVPKMYEGLLKIQKAWGSSLYKKVLVREYSKFEKESVDFGLFEKLPPKTRLTIPISVRWEDAGTWQLFYNAMKEGNEANVVEGMVDTEFIDSKGNFVFGGSKKIITLIDMNNYVVVDTQDALLVCPMEKTDKVKKLFEKIQSNKPKYIE